MNNSKITLDEHLACIISCERCITHCIDSGNKDCIKICRDCADICALCARFEARDSDFSKELHALCAKICQACSIECAKHASHHEACKECAEACIKCATKCEELAKAEQ